MEHEHYEEQGHEVSFGIFALIWLGLMVLTGLTVVAAGINLGNANVIIALAIATVKVTLVGAFFMHLKYEPLYIKLMVLVSILVLTIILTLTFIDTAFRGKDNPKPDKTSVTNK
jgi:cytochrome c oxidase subunit 4|tara:strand:- start:133 stop:474 length:342 start_codon:yes stop_codon:yes gene_type:complete